MKSIGILLASALLSATAFAQTADLNARLRTLALARDAQSVVQLLEQSRSAADTKSAEWLAGVSWAGRAASFVGDWAAAERYAQEAYDGASALLASGAQIASNPQLAALLDLEINLQSQVIGYLNDFKLMTFLTLATIPLLLLIRKPKKTAAPAPMMSE